MNKNIFIGITLLIFVYIFSIISYECFADPYNGIASIIVAFYGGFKVYPSVKKFFDNFNFN